MDAGAPQLGLSILERLEIKNTQLDSILSHFSFPFVQSYRSQEGARKLSLASWQLFTSQKADVEEMTFTTYLQGTYTKIPEFVSFKDRLEMSHTYHLIQCETSIFSIDEMMQRDQPPERFLDKICKERPLERVTSDFFERYTSRQIHSWMDVV